MGKNLTFDEFDFLESLDENITIEEESNHDIAIIGMSIRLPMADDLKTFRESLKSGKNCISDFPESRKKDIDEYLNYRKGYIDENNYIKSGYLNNIDNFDYKFFKMTPKEASLMSPFQRLVLETFYKAIEDAGYGGLKIKSTNTGVYLGYISDLEGYKYREMIMDVESKDNIQISIPGNLSSMMASRISYLLDLRGPSMIIDTACSSSLVALHTACQALRNGDCQMAIVGGVRLSIIPVDTPYKLGIESSDFLAKTFDNSSDGTGTGEGVIALMLKPLKNAKSDKDNIYAIIRGSAINQDGTSMGITAPNVKAQTEVIMKAWEDAGINPGNISYIEAHGTGTKLGDPIEIDAIDKAFMRYTDRKQFCAIGSVKTNIGHLYEAAGLAGVVKAVLSLKYKELYPNIHFNRPNERINFTDSPVFVVDNYTKWNVEGPRICGISSFGFSGTNCHVVLEEYSIAKDEEYKEQDTMMAFTLSAKSRKSILGLLEKYIEFLQENSNLNLSEICYTANTGREVSSYRLGFVVNSVENLEEKINTVYHKIKQYEASQEKIKIEEQGVYYFENGNISKDFENREDALICGNNRRNEDYGNINILKEENIEKLIKEFAMGGDINWESLYGGNKPAKISLPTYCFENTRCWIGVPKINSCCKDTSMFYNINWKSNELNISEFSPINESIIVFADNNASRMKYLENIYDVCKNIVIIESGEAFVKISDCQYIVGQSQVDYDNLFENLSALEFSNIIHMFSLNQNLGNSGEEIDRYILQSAQDKGVKSLYYITKALIKANVPRSNLIVLSEYVSQVDGLEKKIMPENAPLFGLGKVISKENSNIRCKCIDIDEHFTSQNLLGELQSEFENQVCAYRNGKRYIEELDEVLNVEEGCKDFNLKPEGLYIITGGLGGLGFEVAKAFTSKSAINIALINRRSLPPRSEWEDILRKSGDTKICEKISLIKELELNGSNVNCIAADISDYSQLKETIDQLREEYGSIRGIVHAAGIAGEGLIINKDENKFFEVLSPKIQGTWNLYETTQQDNLDFFIMFSSAISVFGVVGQSDYSAANSYMDSMAYYLRRKNIKAMAINWAAWKEVGMAKDKGFDKGQLLFREIQTQTGVNALKASIMNDFTRVMIGALNYTPQLLNILDKLPVKLSEQLKTRIIINASAPTKSQAVNSDIVKSQEELPKVKLTGRESGSYSEVEVKIAQICRDILGFEEISINDNFLEVGADSILLAKIHERLEVEFPNTITMSQMFVYPTISKLSNYINSSVDSQEGIVEHKPDDKDKKDVGKEINDLFNKLESNDLSLEDAIDFIEKM